MWVWHAAVCSTSLGRMVRSVAATARRAEKRQRTVEEQRKIDSEQAARQKQSAQSGGSAEWGAYFELVRGFRAQQGSKWLGVVPKKLRLQGKSVGQWCKRQRQLQVRQPVLAAWTRAVSRDSTGML